MITPSWNGSSIFVLVPIEEMSFFEPYVPNGISIFGLQEVSQHTLFAVNQAFEAFVSDAAPSSCLAMAAIGEEGLARLSKARDLFTKWSGNEFNHPAQIDLSEAGQAIPSLLLERLLERFRSVSKHCITYAGDLARLRGSHEELHNNFAAVEAFIVSSNIQPISLVFSNPPVPGSFLDVAHVKEVTQVLPTSTFALSSVDIYVGELNGSNRRYGGLEIDLTTLEESKILARWHLDADHIAEGWTSLDFAKTLHGHQRTARLAIRAIGGIGDIPPLGLGQPQPLKAFRAEITPQGSSTPNASLALRCWSGLPGIAPPNISKSISFTHLHGASPIKRVAIPFTILRAVEWVKTYWNPGVPPVGFKSEDKAVTCNPPPKGITLAKLPEISLSEISRIEAHAFVRDGDDSPVEFGVLFSDLPAKKIVTALLRGQTAKNKFHFSGWVKCVSGQPVYISSVVPVANMTGCIFLATRIPPGSSRNSAQAAFRDLQITSLGLSDPEQPQVQTSNEGAKIVRAEKPRNRMLPVEDLRRVRGTNGKAGSSQIRFDRASAEIKFELSDEHDVIAVIPDIRVTRPIHLSLKACANRSNKGAIRVGFGVSDFWVSEDTVLTQLKKQTKVMTHVAFSGWHEIGPAEDAVFELDIEDRSEDFVSLYLLAQGEPSLGKNIAEFSNICVLEREQSNG
jgi:hypothetical protein